MNCSIHSKILMIRGVLESYESTTFTDEARRVLAEGLFWLCDSLKEDLASDQRIDAKPCLSTLFVIQQSANDMVKRRLDGTELELCKSECAKLSGLAAVQLE
jgi:hypothetical protein